MIRQRILREDPRYRMTEAGFHMTNEEINQAFKDNLDPEEYALVCTNKATQDDVLRFLLKADLIEIVPQDPQQQELPQP